jgi:hypothetical protein
VTGGKKVYNCKLARSTLPLCIAWRPAREELKKFTQVNWNFRYTIATESKMPSEMKKFKQDFLESVRQTKRDEAARITKVQVASADYDKWFRAQVQASIDDPRPNISAEDARKKMSSQREELKMRSQAGSH